jgi:glycosyltransferase involved in cell wall biosynthesis
MKIVILNTQVPFVWGGAEILAESLRDKLAERGHEAEIVRIPFKWYPAEAIARQMIACRLLKVNPIEPDLVIALKFPAYLVPFPNKKLWLLHQFRQVYELWGTPWQDLPATPAGRAVREMIIQGDNRYLREAKQIFTISKNVAKRLQTYNGIEADGVLYPPLADTRLYSDGEPGDYFFYPSRLVQSKRQEVAIEAMRHVRSPFRLVLTGKADTDGYGAELKKRVARYGLEDRVVFTGYISDEEKARLMAGAMGVLFIPVDEDYGYVTLEAFHSHRPIITFSDSGAPNELVEHELNGLILNPSPEALAEGMEQMWADRSRCRAMGHRAFESLDRHHIHWDHILERLLQ